MYVTVDNEMEFYLDGAKITDDAMKTWNSVSTITYPLNTRVIAIYGRNTGGPKGILASTTTGIVTDGSWRCSNELMDGWMNPGFDDTAWPLAEIKKDSSL